MLHIAYKSNKVFLNNNIEEKILCQLIRMTVLPFMFLILLLTTDIVLEEETKEIETSVRRQATITSKDLTHTIVSQILFCLVQISKAAPGNSSLFFHLHQIALPGGGPHSVSDFRSEIKLLCHFVQTTQHFSQFFCNCCFPKCTQIRKFKQSQIQNYYPYENLQKNY